jgi:hypothetical protein
MAAALTPNCRRHTKPSTSPPSTGANQQELTPDVVTERPGFEPGVRVGARSAFYERKVALNRFDANSLTLITYFYVTAPV